MRFPRPRLRALLALLLGCPLAAGLRAGDSGWVGVWATAPIQEETPASLLQGRDTVLRQVVRVSGQATALRLRLSNEYGAGALEIARVRLAAAGPAGTVVAGTNHVVRFGSAEAASIPAGAFAVSDPVDFPVRALEDVAVTLELRRVPARVAGHPGSRTTSYLLAGGDPDSPRLEGATAIVHWYFICGIEAQAPRGAGAIVCLGDSFTDGYGCRPDQNSRWTDALAKRLQSDPATSGVSVLNLGIGGGRLLRPGNGPSGLSRLQRDVFGQAGVKWVVLQLGVNDLGTRVKAQKAGQPFASAADIVAGYHQVIEACHARGVRVAIATITPFLRNEGYCTPEIERDRRVINAWIRREAGCDAVLDLDEALRDRGDPTRLREGFDSGDHLHPSMEGYRYMGTLLPSEFLFPRADRAADHPE